MDTGEAAIITLLFAAALGAGTSLVVVAVAVRVGMAGVRRELEAATEQLARIADALEVERS